MKKITFMIIAIALFSVGKLSAQAEEESGQAFEQGKIVVSAGYGFPNFTKLYFKAFQNYGGYTTTGVGPVHFKFEYAIADKIGLGLSINYSSYKVEWDYTDSAYSYTKYKEGFKGSSISAILRMNVHFATSEKLDPYFGIGVGYRTNSFSYYNTDPFYRGTARVTGAIIPVGFETTLGLRYFFTENIGAYMEMGVAKSLIQGGVSIKF